MISITFYSVVQSILVSSLLIVLIYFFRKKESFSNIFGVKMMLALYAITLFRIFVLFEFQDNAIQLIDYNVYPKIMDTLTPDVTNIVIPQLTLLNVLLVVWGIGTVFLTVRFFFKYFKAIGHYTACSHPAKSDRNKQFGKIAKQCQIKREVEFKVTDKVDSPVTFGFFKPVVLFPEYEYQKKDFTYIAFHECCHIKNKDIWIKLLVAIYCALFWWNPFVYLLKKDLSYCLEMKCDSTVLKFYKNGNCIDYGRTLLNEMKRVAELKKSRQSTHLKSAFLGIEFSNDDSKRIIQRFDVITKPRKKRTKSVLICISFAVVVAALIVFSYVVIIQPGWQPTYEDYTEDVPDTAVVEVADSDDAFYYLTKDGTYYFVHEPYVEGKEIVLTDENSIKLPKDLLTESDFTEFRLVKEK